MSSKEKINIIIIEDDKDVQKMYKDSIDEYNKDSAEYEFVCDHLNNDTEVPRILFEKRVDAMVIDLDWGMSNRKGGGNELVRKIYCDCRIPIFIVSGNLNTMEDYYKQSPIFKIYNRDEKTSSELLEEIAGIFQTGYTRAMGNNGQIDTMLGRVFWKYLSDIVLKWESKDSTVKMLRFAVGRIGDILSTSNGASDARSNHLNSRQDNELDDNRDAVSNQQEGNLEENIDSRSSQQDDYSTLEFYVKPPIRNVPFSGDIVQYDDKLYVVITPSCDLEQRKADRVALCQVDDSYFESLRQESGAVSNRKKEEIKRYTNNGVPRYHLLPPCHLFDGGLVDYQNIMSISKEVFYDNSKVKPIASISSVFHKDIQARFSHYYGRQGQPQLNSDSIIDWIESKKA